MKIGKYILSLDQGTTSSRAVLFDALGGVAGMGQREFTQIYPKPGYVEHDAVEILQTQLYAMRQAVHEADITAEASARRPSPGTPRPASRSAMRSSGSAAAPRRNASG